MCTGDRLLRLVTDSEAEEAQDKAEKQLEAHRKDCSGSDCQCSDMEGEDDRPVDRGDHSGQPKDD